jgi:hypothetical protein
MNCTQEIRVARLIALWMASIIAVMGFVVSDNPIFRLGPNENLQILNIAIDTPAKYTAIVSVCFANSCIRTLNHNILHPWIINTIQDKTSVVRITYHQSYELSFVYTIYNWFDFFLYMNILMSQIDMLLIEIIADLIVTFVLTTNYIRNRNVHAYQPIETND